MSRPATGSAMVIEDDASTASALSRIIASLGYNVRTVANPVDAREALGERLPDVVLVDPGVPDGSGVKLVRELTERGDVNVVVITGSQSREYIVASLRAGAAEYLVKPVRLSAIHEMMRRFNVQQQQRHQGEAFTAVVPAVEPALLPGTSPAVKALRQQIADIAAVGQVRAIIDGGTGLGKRNVAATIHEQSGASGKLVMVDCAQEIDAMSPARMFGRTDLTEGVAVTGYFELAEGGTLVLDDVSRLHGELQQRVANHLETLAGQVQGVTACAVAGLSVIAILRESALDAMNADRLREDLFRVLARSTLTVPDLADRPDDLIALAESTLADLNRQHGLQKSLSDDFRDLLQAHPFPGNVTELKQLVRAGYAGTDADDEILPDRCMMPALGDTDANEATALVGFSLWDIEKMLLLATLDETSGNKRQAAELLGISLKTLYNRLHAYQ